MPNPEEKPEFLAEITIQVKSIGGPGLLASLQTDGDFASQMIDSRYYSIAERPPDGYPPARFWGELFTLMGEFLMQPD